MAHSQFVTLKLMKLNLSAYTIIQFEEKDDWRLPGRHLACNNATLAAEDDAGVCADHWPLARQV